MSITALQSQVDKLSTEQAKFQQATLNVSALNATQRRELLEAIAPSGLKIHLSNDIVEIGDQVYGELGGVYVEGKSLVNGAITVIEQIEPNDEF